MNGLITINSDVLIGSVDHRIKRLLAKSSEVMLTIVFTLHIVNSLHREFFHMVKFLSYFFPFSTFNVILSEKLTQIFWTSDTSLIMIWLIFIRKQFVLVRNFSASVFNTFLLDIEF